MLSWPGCPSSDLTRKQIKHYRQVQEAVVRADVGDVRDPRAIWLTDFEAASQNVLGD